MVSGSESDIPQLGDNISAREAATEPRLPARVVASCYFTVFPILAMTVAPLLRGPASGPPASSFQDKNTAFTRKRKGFLARERHGAQAGHYLRTAPPANAPAERRGTLRLRTTPAGGEAYAARSACTQSLRAPAEGEDPKAMAADGRPNTAGCLALQQRIWRVE